MNPDLDDSNLDDDGLKPTVGVKFFSIKKKFNKLN